MSEYIVVFIRIGLVALGLQFFGALTANGQTVSVEGRNYAITDFAVLAKYVNGWSWERDDPMPMAGTDIVTVGWIPEMSNSFFSETCKIEPKENPFFPDKHQDVLLSPDWLDNFWGSPGALLLDWKQASPSNLAAQQKRCNAFVKKNKVVINDKPFGGFSLYLIYGTVMNGTGLTHKECHPINVSGCNNIIVRRIEYQLTVGAKDSDDRLTNSMIRGIIKAGGKALINYLLTHRS